MSVNVARAAGDLCLTLSLFTCPGIFHMHCPKSAGILHAIVAGGGGGGVLVRGDFQSTFLSMEDDIQWLMGLGIELGSALGPVCCMYVAMSMMQRVKG